LLDRGSDSLRAASEAAFLPVVIVWVPFPSTLRIARVRHATASPERFPAYHSMCFAVTVATIARVAHLELVGAFSRRSTAQYGVAC
jgi:hypothetical protein